MSRSEYQANASMHFAATSYPAERARLVQALQAPKHRPHAAKVAKLIAPKSFVSRLLSFFA